MNYFFNLKYRMMNFQKVILASFCCICFTFFSNNLIGQTPQKVEVDDKVEKRGNDMVLQKKKKTISKIEKEKQLRKTKERKSIQKKKILYLSTSRIERAKVDLEKKKKQGKISQKEILQEEKKIKKSETQLEKRTKKVSKFSKKFN